ncbi:hypothetical protein [Staphylospora marina]|uniref:hypothetical protein n=1 Tax=Staphylospora marina TaxID=2490858 RepID=UPI000F5B9CED|nr:hypothetical protein [Staphylospora marina]
MSERLKAWLRTAGVYGLVAALAVGAHMYYLSTRSTSWIEEFREAGGYRLVSELGDTYKSIIEMYSNYKLNKDSKPKIVSRLGEIHRKLQEVEQKLQQADGERRIDFSYVYHDIKLVSLSLSDVTKDDIVPVIVLHAMEGVGDLKKQLTYVEYR